MCLTGAVTIRMRVFDSGVCFIAAHLSSGENEGDELKRNYDYSEIIRRGAFHGDGGALDPDSLAAAASAASLQEGVSKVTPMFSCLGKNFNGPAYQPGRCTAPATSLQETSVKVSWQRRWCKFLMVAVCLTLVWPPGLMQPVVGP